MRVAIYTRVSTEDQAREGFSLEVQKEVLFGIAEQNHWEVVCSIPDRKIYEDDGYSGGSMDRPAFKILRSDAGRKFFDMILVYKLDRMNRRLKDLLTFLEEIENYGISIKSATEPFDTSSSAGKFLIHMIGSSAEFERNRLIERVFPGMVMGVKKGHWQGSRYSPYGYRYNKEKRKLEVVENEAALVKEIYSMYLAGHSTSKIAGILFHKKIPTRSGGKFHTKLICDILKNKVYLGKLVWNRRRYDTKQKTSGGKGYRYVKNPPSKIIEVDGVHESIIDENTFMIVQRRLKQNARTNSVKFKGNVYYLSGVTYCAVCGLKYYGAMIVTDHRRQLKKAWYRCAAKSYPYMRCSNGQTTAENLHHQIWKILEELCKIEAVGEGFEHLLIASSNEHNEHFDHQIAEKQKALDRNLSKQGDHCELYNADMMNIDVYRTQLQKLREEEKELKLQIKQLQLSALDHDRGIDERLRAQQFLRNVMIKEHKWTDADIKEFIRIIFKRIVVRDDQVIDYELNRPWNLLYEKELKCRTRNFPPIGKISRSAYVVSRSAVR